MTKPGEAPSWPNGPIWLIGCGNMAGAMLHRWLATGLDPAQITIIRKSGTPFADGIRVLTAPPIDEATPAIAMLGVKPQMIDDVAPALSAVLGPDTLLVSILAGVELDSLRRRFSIPRAILRANPNTPVALGKGVVGMVGDGLSPAQHATAEAMMARLGLFEWVDQAALDVVTALSGSGPAFLFRFIDALGEAGVHAGLPADQAQRMALATVAGAAALAEAAGESPRQLAERVTSKGGSTRKGLDVLDAPNGLQPLLDATIAAAVQRNREMAAEARKA